MTVSARQVRLVFLGVLLLLGIGVLANRLPLARLTIVSGQQYDTLETENVEAEDNQNTTTQQSSSSNTTSQQPSGSSTSADSNDPFAGSLAVEAAALRVPTGTRTDITEDAEIHWHPQRNTGTGLFVAEGQDFLVSGLDESGEWVRIIFEGEAGWVRRANTTVPPVRIQESFD